MKLTPEELAAIQERNEGYYLPERNTLQGGVDAHEDRNALLKHIRSMTVVTKTQSIDILIAQNENMELEAQLDAVRGLEGHMSNGEVHPSGRWIDGNKLQAILENNRD